MNEEELINQFQAVEDIFNQAVVSNNTSEIRKCVSDDWVLIDTQGGIIPKERFFYVVEQGMLRHTSMSKEILRVKVYENMAIVTGRGKNTCFFNGQPIKADEWVTDIYKKENEKWICVLTHLTRVASKS